MRFRIKGFLKAGNSISVIDDQVYSILYNAQDTEIHNKNGLQSNELEVADLLDDVRWCPTKTDIQKQWEAAVSSISLEIASFDPRPRVVELPKTEEGLGFK